MSHLRPGTQKALADLLCKETLADISTYPDELRADSFFNYMAPYHYMDVPPNENFEQFKASVDSQTNANVYTALQHWEKELGDSTKPKAVRVFALKWVVHLIEDLHQPLHIGRQIDMGGNLVSCTFYGEKTNLHALWDSKLIERTGMTSVQLATDWDIATPQDIRKWQSDSLINWCYESNQYCNQIYDKLPENKELGEKYYKQYIGLVRQRIDQAGIRLAGELNRILEPLVK